MGSRSPHMKGNFEGEKWPAQDMPGHALWLIYLKQLGRWQDHYDANADWSILGVVHIGATWLIQLNPPCLAAMQPYQYVKLL